MIKLSDLKKTYKTPNFNDLTDKQVEAEKDKYWKCPSCHELVYLNEGCCWKCETSKPLKFERPGTEDIKREMKGNKHLVPFWSGIAGLFGAVAMALRGYILYGDSGDWPDFIDIFVIAIFLVPGIALIIYSGYQKKSSK